MIVNSFGQHLSRTVHDHGGAAFAGAVGGDGGAAGAGVHGPWASASWRPGRPSCA